MSTDNHKASSAAGAQMSHRLAWNLDLMRVLVARQMHSQYRAPLLGYLWSLATPLLLVLVFYFVFQIVMDIGVPNYATHIFSGLIVFNWFQSGLQRSCRSIVSNRDLLMQPGMHRAALPVVAVIEAMIPLLIAFPVLLIFVIVGGGSISVWLLALPVLLLVQGAFTTGLAFFASAVNTLFRDVEQVLGILLRMLLFLSPVFYRRSFVPENAGGIYDLNPMVSFINAFRAVTVVGEQPRWTPLLVLAVISVVLIFAGYRTFQRLSRRFVENV